MKKRTGAVAPVSAARTVKYNAAKEKEDNVIGLRIAEARRRKGLTLAAFCESLKGCGVKITPGGAGKWETGYSIPNAYQLIAICSALEIEDQIPFFMSDYVPALNAAGMRKVEEYKADLLASGKYRPVIRQANVIRFVEMPVSNLAVSAGTGEFLDEGSFEMISFPANTVPEGADFGVRVSGDSMEPVYHDGQIVWVQECDRIGIGQVGVFICGGEGYLKMYAEREPDESAVDEYRDSYGVVHPQPVLESYNRKYEPRVIGPDTEFRIVGRVL